MRWFVEDPYGLSHIVEETDDGDWFGCENVAMAYSTESRHVLTLVFQRELKANPHGGQWSNFTWIPMFS